MLTLHPKISMSGMENKNIIVGRRQEMALLQEILSSTKAELVAVYGRRKRVPLSLGCLIRHLEMYAPTSQGS